MDKLLQRLDDSLPITSRSFSFELWPSVNTITWIPLEMSNLDKVSEYDPTPVNTPPCVLGNSWLMSMTFSIILEYPLQPIPYFYTRARRLRIGIDNLDT